MLIIPAIDLLDGNVVRLYKGKRESARVYSNAPADMARQFVAAGARRVHVVDLNAAFGDGDNRAAIAAIVATGADVQLGGGLRSVDACKAAVDAGARWLVLGSALVKDPRAFAEACAQFSVVAAIDARDGKLAVSGWTEQTDVDASDVAARAVEAGARGVLYTDIGRDGTAQGPNVEATARLARTLHPTEVIASGGIGAVAHLRELALAGVPACVVGRALYDQKFSLAEAMEAAGER